MTTLNSVLPQNFAEALNKNDISLVRAMLIAELNDSNVNIDDVLNIIAHIENIMFRLFSKRLMKIRRIGLKIILRCN